jgi:hypothetical protein
VPACRWTARSMQEFVVRSTPHQHWMPQRHSLSQA